MISVIKDVLYDIERKIASERYQKDQGKNFVSFALPLQSPNGTYLAPYRQEMNEHEVEQHILLPYRKQGYKVEYSNDHMRLIISWAT